MAAKDTQGGLEIFHDLIAVIKPSNFVLDAEFVKKSIDIIVACEAVKTIEDVV